MCIKHYEISELLYEEDYCIKKCLSKLNEVQKEVKVLMNDLGINKISSEYLS